MKLITAEIRKALLENAELSVIAESKDELFDPKPVVKFFVPWSRGTWLITEMVDEDTLFGLADLGMGCPELGYVSLSELERIRGMGGLRIERDAHFVPDKTLSGYYAKAREEGSINA